MKDCIICYEEIIENKTELKCENPINHVYHKECIEEWIKKQKKYDFEDILYNCPYCRKRHVYKVNKIWDGKRLNMYMLLIYFFMYYLIFLIILFCYIFR